MQSTPSSAYVYPMSPVPNPALYDSGYASFNYASPMNASPFHFSSCPYSNEPVYAASQPYPAYYGSPSYVYPENPTPCLSSTPMQPSNVCLVEVPQNSQLKRRQPRQRNPAASPAMTNVRKRISDQAIDRLNAFYALKKRPTEAEKDRLAMECNITLSQVNTWFNNARSRRGDTNPKLTQKILKQQIDSLSGQVAFLQQQQSSSTEHGFL